MAQEQERNNIKYPTDPDVIAFDDAEMFVDRAILRADRILDGREASNQDIITLATVILSEQRIARSKM